MVKFIVLVTVALTVLFLLQITEAKSAGEGFCYKKIVDQTGECRGKMRDRHQKVDCCSNGGAGWSLRKKDRANCEPCQTTEYSGSGSGDGWETIDGSGSGASGSGSGGWEGHRARSDDEDY